MQKPDLILKSEPVVAALPPSKLFAAAGSAEEAQSGGRSAWRISSTMFTTLCHDTLLEPIGVFASEPTVRSQPLSSRAAQLPTTMSLPEPLNTVLELTAVVGCLCRRGITRR